MIVCKSRAIVRVTLRACKKGTCQRALGSPEGRLTRSLSRWAYEVGVQAGTHNRRSRLFGVWNRPMATRLGSHVAIKLPTLWELSKLPL